MLYAGLMLTKQGLKVLEFNCRFGDPECQVGFLDLRPLLDSIFKKLKIHVTPVRPLLQVLLPLLQSDLYEVILNTVGGKLASNAPVWRQDASAVTVVMASAGYPGSYEKGVEITGTATLQQFDTTSVLWLFFPSHNCRCRRIFTFEEQ